MTNPNTYDAIIAGGGLAGLAAAILLARDGHSILVLEKDAYPRHKVCGEYISMESKAFLQQLGLSIDDLPVINKVQLTDIRGNELTAHLPQGGFGISRYKIDAALAALAQQAGATVLTKTRIDNIQYTNSTFAFTTRNEVYTAKAVIGAWGKRSNIDVKWDRPFIKEKNSALNNYVGIKYHINADLPANVVALHNFSGGYCGVSAIEENKHCLCYLTTAANLQKNGNDIKRMEQEVLMKNPHLRDIFGKATFLYEQPLAISQISFERKELVYDHVLMAGDASGMITPLCGNGMSMALHAGKIAAHLTSDFLRNKISRIELELRYTKQWEARFAARIRVGRMVQAGFGKDRLTAVFIKTAKAFPPLQRMLIKSTSGTPF